MSAAIRDEVVEAMAHVLYDLRYPNTVAKWATVSEFHKERFSRQAEAALDAALNVLEAHIREGRFGWHYSRSLIAALRESGGEK